MYSANANNDLKHTRKNISTIILYVQWGLYICEFEDVQRFTMMGEAYTQCIIILLCKPNNYNINLQTCSVRTSWTEATRQMGVSATA